MLCCAQDFMIEFFGVVIVVQDAAYYDDSESYYSESSLADMVTEFLGHLSSSPGSFESDVEYITGMLNSCVYTEELLEELVELIYTQVTVYYYIYIIC